MEKIAVVLVENFSAKLVIASVVDNNYFVFSDMESEVVNLDLVPDADMFLKKNQIDGAIKVLKNFRKICEMHQVNSVQAIIKSLKMFIVFLKKFLTLVGLGFQFLVKKSRTLAFTVELSIHLISLRVLFATSQHKAFM